MHALFASSWFLHVTFLMDETNHDLNLSYYTGQSARYASALIEKNMIVQHEK